MFWFLKLKFSNSIVWLQKKKNGNFVNILFLVIINVKHQTFVKSHINSIAFKIFFLQN